MTVINPDVGMVTLTSEITVAGAQKPHWSRFGTIALTPRFRHAMLSQLTVRNAPESARFTFTENSKKDFVLG